jgi:hypothetical protein
MTAKAASVVKLATGWREPPWRGIAVHPPNQVPKKADWNAVPRET